MKKADDNPQRQISDAQIGSRACSACGAAARRRDAKFCSSCGGNLREDYFPTDYLRASYSMSPVRNDFVLVNPKRSYEAKFRRASLLEFSKQDWRDAAILIFAALPFTFTPTLGFYPIGLIIGALFFIYCRKGGKKTDKRGATFILILGISLLVFEFILLLSIVFLSFVLESTF